MLVFPTNFQGFKDTFDPGLTSDLNHLRSERKKCQFVVCPPHGVTYYAVTLSEDVTHPIIASEKIVLL